MSDLHERTDLQREQSVIQLELAQSRKASDALQRMVDALASLDALEQFVPAALRIIATTFETRDCHYFGHRLGGAIHLKYSCLDGDVFGPEDIRAFGDDHKYAGIKTLAAGIHVPESYLGVPFRTRTKAPVVNDGSDQFAGHWEDIRKLFGWYTVLNVPLIIGGEAVGELILNRTCDTEFAKWEIELAERLGQQLALAMHVDRLAADARGAAGVQARELAAQVQIEEMAKTDHALQQITTALAAVRNLANFIPSALQIIATAFNARDCAYYEHRFGEPIRLRYKLSDNSAESPDGVAGLEQEELGFLRQLYIDGFTGPGGYLGAPRRQRTKASIVDHTRGEPPTIYDNFCNGRGWHLELNLPLVVAGETDGTIIIYRDMDTPYTLSEIKLAERLAQPLAFAVEASRHSAAAKDMALAWESERAASEQTVEPSKYADVLKQTIDSLIDEEDFLGLIGRLLVIASRQLQAPITEYWTDDGLSRTALILTNRNGVVYKGSDDPRDVRRQGVPISKDIVGVERYQDRTTHQIIDMLQDKKFRDHLEGLGMPVAEWCRERAVQQLIIVPMLRNERAQGSLCLYLPKDRIFEKPQFDLAFSLAQQISLAVRMTELAEESKQNALSREREEATNDRAAELVKANHLLRSTLDQLSDERDFQTFPRTILRAAMEQSGARDGVIFVLDKKTDTLRRSEYLRSQNSLPASTIEFAEPFPATSMPAWSRALAARAPVVCDTETDGHHLLPGAADWHLKRGNRSVVIVPMFINMEPYGYFGMGLPQPAEAVSNVDLGLLQALTQQASLAIHLARLAEESKQTAVARERERDAEERAAEFANANEVLRATLDQLSKDHDLHSFPRTILTEAMRHAGGRDGLILLYDPHSDTLNRSEYINADGLPASKEFFQPFSASGTPAWAALLSKRAPIVFDTEQDAAILLPGLAEWHRRRGNRSIIAAAMFLDSRPYGYFGITLGERASEVSKVKVGLIHALTQQATLAIQLTRLAETSQRAAIMVERQQVVVQERANLAREIHDKLAQGYAAILMQQHTMRRTLQRTGIGIGIEVATPLLEQLDIIEQLSRENLAEARRTMDELRVDPFGPGDLGRTLERCIGQLSKERNFTVSLQLEEDLPPLRRYVETELCRIVLEAVTNARKHSRSGSAHVSAVKEGNGLSLKIEDKGVGFDMQTIGTSFGIFGMQERAARAGARMEILSAAGCGTKVHITVTP